MIYVVEVSYMDFVFDTAEDAMGFAEMAKRTAVKDDKNVSVSLYTKAEWDAKNKKKED